MMGHRKWAVPLGIVLFVGGMIATKLLSGSPTWGRVAWGAAMFGVALVGGSLFSRWRSSRCE
jgi:hypothetical protein